jgi:hypothetical protein
LSLSTPSSRFGAIGMLASMLGMACTEGADQTTLGPRERDRAHPSEGPAPSKVAGNQPPDATFVEGSSGVLVAALEAGETVDGSTLQDFSGMASGACPGDGAAGTPFACYHDALDESFASFALLDGGRDDPVRFLRLAGIPAAGHDHNTISFPLTAPGARETLLADFDFRITPVEGRGRADGFGFAFLNTAFFPEGAVAPTPIAEEPSFPGSIGVGFDIYKGGAEADIGNENITATFSDSLSIHQDGQVLAQLDVEKISDIGSGLWHHARVLVHQTPGGAHLSLWLTPPCGQPFIVVEERAIVTALPYEARAWFGARSGGEASNHDLANVRVHFMPAGASWVSFVSRSYEADETGGSVTLELRREGELGTEVSVDFTTRALSAVGGEDFASTTGSVTFAAGQTDQTIVIPLLDDALDETRFGPAPGRAEVVPEVVETFEVALTAASPGAVLAGPALARVSVYDDEGARLHGHFGAPLCWHIIGMHSHVLPQTGQVLYWDRLGNVAEWSPQTGEATLIDGPGHNLFCAGHSFMPDGELLIAGGHDDPLGASTGHDGVGIDNLGLFQPMHLPEEHPWHPLLPMNAPRWYPTVTTLSNGAALLFSGSLDINYTKNFLPQVYELGSEALRDLTAATDPVPHGVQLYPWMFALPGARVVKVGPDADSWLLDTAAAGAWTKLPVRPDGLVLDYGSSVLRDHHALVFGGAGAEPTSAGPSNVVAELELAADGSAPDGWVVRPGMLIPRRQHNATLLPDGRVLVTGGSSAPGFSNRAGSATPAEVFDGEGWQLLPAAVAQRLYHSSAVLLPDGRVVTAGGGEGAGATSFQSSAEIYFPDYWFKPRPALLAVPREVVYDAPFELASSATIERVTLLRMSSVTHSFDQNQRFVELPFTRSAAGVSALVAGDGWVPPGHYILYVLDAADLPSLGAVVHVSDGG